MRAPRPYRDQQDLNAMQDLLIRGRQANNGSYYIHSGDLAWWLYYPPLEGDFWEHIHVWEDPDHPGRILGWVLISPDWVGIDVYLQPELMGSQFAMDMYLWAEEEATRIAHRKGKKTVYALWIRHDDRVLTDHFIQGEYRLKRGMVHFFRTLAGALPVTELAAGYSLRSCKGIPEVAARASAQYAAFSSNAPFERYLERFTRFMGSPVYRPELDVVAIAPDGRICAFCIVWTDDVNRVGLFEPVGTHPDFQRLGVGKAVMLEGLHRLQQHGMQSAIVSTLEDNMAGIKLYEAVGFQEICRLGTYEKDV